MMVAAGFDHANDELGTVRTDPAATGEPTSFELRDGTEVLYTPSDPNYHGVIKRPTVSSPSARGPIIAPE